MTKTLRIIANIVIYTLIVTLVISVLCQYLLNKPLGWQIVASSSMEPAFHKGDIIFALPFAFHQPQEGDVVVFVPKEDVAMVHRIVGETDGGYVTKGDANSYTDQEEGWGLVTADQMVGVVPSFKVPAIGSLIQRLGYQTKLPPILFALMGFTLAVVVGDWLIKKFGPRRRRRLVRPKESFFSRHWLAAFYVVLGAFTAVVFIMLASLASPQGQMSYRITDERVTVAGKEEGGFNFGVVLEGEEASRTVPLTNSSRLPMVIVFLYNSDAISFPQNPVVIPSGQAVDVTATLLARDDVGYYREPFTLLQLPMLLPANTIYSLAQHHILLPIVAVALIGSAAILLPIAIIGYFVKKLVGESREPRRRMVVTARKSSV